MALADVVSSVQYGEQDQDRHRDGLPNGGTTVVAGSTKRSSTADSQRTVLPRPNSPAIQTSNLSKTKPPVTVMPPIDITHNISLHSPTPLMGTPFDVKANKFEYPFPDPDSQLSSAVSDLSSPISTSRPPSGASQPLLSGSPPPLVNSPPMFSSSLNFSPAHPKLRTNVREPPVPPGLITKRRRISENSLLPPRRSPSMESAWTGSSDFSASGNISPMSWGSTLSSSVESSLEQDQILRHVAPPTDNTQEKEVISGILTDLEQRSGNNVADTHDKAVADERTDDGDVPGEITPVPLGLGNSGGSPEGEAKHT